eukprot:CAMPEP_0197523222 /NCGR_PEP_ID=MMETSP1318-20131121/8200_1 /TAXON_ID=552666 /ORGANISM="Partenskyella glossopodia, Strain RCC365" /LENGTH=698 /DNA_ID=CAMNT_0043075847 /DNA_START=11 /DNA_END=2107 /DNA_ORIENTATION=+
MAHYPNRPSANRVNRQTFSIGGYIRPENRTLDSVNKTPPAPPARSESLPQISRTSEIKGIGGGGGESTYGSGLKSLVKGYSDTSRINFLEQMNIKTDMHTNRLHKRVSLLEKLIQDQQEIILRLEVQQSQMSSKIDFKRPSSIAGSQHVINQRFDALEQELRSEQARRSLTFQALSGDIAATMRGLRQVVEATSDRQKQLEDAVQIIGDSGQSDFARIKDKLQEKERKWFSIMKKLNKDTDKRVAMITRGLQTIRKDNFTLSQTVRSQEKRLSRLEKLLETEIQNRVDSMRALSQGRAIKAEFANSAPQRIHPYPSYYSPHSSTNPLPASEYNQNHTKKHAPSRLSSRTDSRGYQYPWPFEDELDDKPAEAEGVAVLSPPAAAAKTRSQTTCADETSNAMEKAHQVQGGQVEVQAEVGQGEDTDPQDLEGSDIRQVEQQEQPRLKDPAGHTEEGVESTASHGSVAGEGTPELDREAEESADVSEMPSAHETNDESKAADRKAGNESSYRGGTDAGSDGGAQGREDEAAEAEEKNSPEEATQAVERNENEPAEQKSPNVMKDEEVKAVGSGKSNQELGEKTGPDEESGHCGDDGMQTSGTPAEAGSKQQQFVEDGTDLDLGGKNELSPPEHKKDLISDENLHIFLASDSDFVVSTRTEVKSNASKVAAAANDGDVESLALSPSAVASGNSDTETKSTEK